MAKKKVRECAAKQLFKKLMKKAAEMDVRVKVVQVTPSTDMAELPKANPWLLTDKLVVKPDMLFGKRGKSGLVLVNVTWEKACEFLKEKMNSMITMGGLTGKMTNFLVEGFVPHAEDKEYYMSIVTKRLGNVVNFSAKGGISVEENWEENMVSVFVGVFEDIANVDLAGKIGEKVGPEQAAVIAPFLKGCYKVFTSYDYALLEMNPFIVDMEAKECVPLDMRTELDDCGRFRQVEGWGDVEFPESFGKMPSSEEEYISSLDEKTGASLKLTILNPKGRVWTMVAGGGASVIYADTVADLNYGGELGNYGEYSGAPNQEETFCYAKTLLDLVTRNPDGRNRALIIGGGIANFTDVAATFKGIIRAIREYHDLIVKAQVKIFIRRGGPNEAVGLELMRKLSAELNLGMDVFGPEYNMSHPVPLALDWVAKTP